MEPRHVVLVRHGESQLNAANRLQRIYCGQIETPLTEMGRQQALDACRKLNALKYLRLKRAISSTLERARDTLRLILSQWSDPVQIMAPSAALMERCHGVFEGKSEEEVFADYPHYRDDANYSRFMNHFEQHAPEGENLTTVTRRAWPIVSELAESGEGDVLVVSHYNTIRCIVGKALELPTEDVLRMRIPNAMPIILRWNGPCELIEGREILDPTWA